MNRIDRLLPPILKGLGMEEAVRLEGIKRGWPSIFREPLSLHMSPSVLKNGELLITVDSPVWLQQLTFFKNEIVGNLNAFGVKDVRFRIGRVNVKRSKGHQDTRIKPSLEEEARKEIEETVSEIKDPSMKESVRRVMGKALARKNTKL